MNKQKLAIKYGDECIDFMESIEEELKEFATLEHYGYEHSDETKENIHNFIFKAKSDKAYTDEEVKKIEAKINTYDEGSVTFGNIFLGSIYVTIVGTD